MSSSIKEMVGCVQDSSYKLNYNLFFLSFLLRTHVFTSTFLQHISSISASKK